MTLVCALCKALRGEIYRIPVSGVGDLVMCTHVVNSVVQTHRLVADETAPVGTASAVGRS